MKKKTSQDSLLYSNMEYDVQVPGINTSRNLSGHPILEKSIKHYSNSHQILLVGEGDFSFSLALANVFGSAENMIPTSLDSREKVLQLYDSAHTTLSNLERLGAKILHGVDATKMEKHPIIRTMRFDRIVYNFPHAGFFGKEDDQNVIKGHRHLLKMFFKNAGSLLNDNGEIHVTHKKNGPYDKWELVKQAEEWGLHLKGPVPFRITDYPGYTNRRGAGSNAGDSFFLGKCQTYKFFLRHDFLCSQVISPNFYSEASAENYKAALWEPEPNRKMRMAGEMAVLWEPEPERQTRMPGETESERHIRKAAETETSHLDTSSNDLKVILNEELNKNDELKRQRDWVLRQLEEACRENTNIAKRLDEVLRLNEAAVKHKDTILKEAMSKDTILNQAMSELDFERKARKFAEAEKTDLEMAFSHKCKSLNKEQKENHELKRQRDEALRQKEEACKEKTIIAKELAEALRLVENAVEQKGKILWHQKDLRNQKNKISLQIVVSSGLAFALYIFCKRRARI